MRSASFSTFGKPSDVLKIEDRPLPEPGPGQVRVRMRMSAIHNHDLLTVSGDYGIKPQLPAVAGTEATGVVDAVGEGVTHLQPGQRVAASGQGAWADYYLASVASAVPLPDAISDEAAAQMISMPLSALALLDYLEAKPGDWIIQNAANGAVGRTLAMFAKRRGVHVVNVVRRESAVEEMRRVGIDHVVSTDGAGWKDEVAGFTGGAPIKVAIDGVGGASSGELLSLLGQKGVLLSFGLMSGQPMQLSPSDLIFKETVVKGFWLAKVGPALGPEKIGRLVGEIVESVAKGEIDLPVSDIFDLVDVSSAVAAAAEGHRKGKVLIKA